MTLLEYCNKFQINYSQLARVLECSQPHISMVARNICHPSFKLAVKIEKITDKKVPRTNWYPNE